MLVDDGLLRQRQRPGSRVVAGQPVADVLEDAEEPHAGDLSVFAGGRQDDAGDRRHERRRKPGVRQERQVPVFHRQHQLGRGHASRISRASSRPVTASVYLVVLSKDEASPLAPESDEEKKPSKKDEAKKDEAKTQEGRREEGRRQEGRRREGRRQPDVKVRQSQERG